MQSYWFPSFYSNFPNTIPPQPAQQYLTEKNWFVNQNSGRNTPESRKDDLPLRLTSSRDSHDWTIRTISGYGYGKSTTPKIQDRLPQAAEEAKRGSDRGSRQSDGARESKSESKSWRDALMEKRDSQR